MTDAAGDLATIIQGIEREMGAAESGLPEELFLFVSRVTPLVNVDLLIQDDRNRTLLTWRSDRFHGPGWHIPGGFIRYKERAAERIGAVAQRELNAQVDFDSAPVLVHESIRADWRDRGHLISLLYRCRLLSALDERQRFTPSAPLPGQWLWHQHCPQDLIAEQQPYAALIGLPETERPASGLP